VTRIVTGAVKFSCMDDETMAHEQEERKPKKAAIPRFGPFLTITAAILLLFGAASRVGKMEETFALFGLDSLANSRIQREEDRLRAALHTIGAVPVQRDVLHPPAGNVQLQSNVPPPYRGEVDPEDVQDNGRSQLSLGVPAGSWESGQFGQAMMTPDDNDAPRQRMVEPAPEPSGPTYYVVETGDTWNRIAKKTLGDGSRWQEIRKANPTAQNGLTVGMRLMIVK
jgi:LysM domain.